MTNNGTGTLFGSQGPTGDLPTKTYRVCLHGSDSAQTRTTAISSSLSPWAAARVECACVPHRACQAVKMLSNTIYSLHTARGATRRGTVSEGRQRRFALRVFYGHRGSVTANLLARESRSSLLGYALACQAVRQGGHRRRGTVTVQWQVRGPVGQAP